MDHHCRLVDNCIGFYNRKFFIQLLFYVCVLTIYIDITLAYFVFYIIKDIIRMKLAYNNIIHASLILSCFSFVFAFSIIITIFFKFHIILVLTNSTTIESLDKEHKEENAKFCLSRRENWEQVMGTSALLWFIPIDVEKGRPVGDGLTWTTREENNTINNNNPPSGQNLEMKNLNNYNTNYATTSPMSPQNV